MPLTVKLDCAVLGILGGDTGLGIELVAEHDHLLGQTLRGRSGIQVQLARVDGDGDSLLGFEGLLVHGGVGDAVLAVFVGVECIALDYRLILDTGVSRNTVNGYGDLLGRGCTALVSCRIGNVIVAGRIGLNGTPASRVAKSPVSGSVAETPFFMGSNLIPRLIVMFFAPLITGGRFGSLSVTSISI